MKRLKESWPWVLLALATLAVAGLVTFHPWFAPLKEFVLLTSSSNFFIAFLGALGGSIGGASVMILIERRERQNRFLADINAAIGALSGLINTLLNVKMQHTMPLNESYEHNVSLFEKAKATQQGGVPPHEQVAVLSMNTSRIQMPKLRLALPMDRICSTTYKAAKIIPVLSKAEQTVDEINDICREWNEQVSYMSSLENQNRIIQHYFGVGATDGSRDTIFGDTIKNMKKSIDDGLFFARRSIDKLTELGNETLPFRLRGKIAKSSTTVEKYKSLMPPPDHKKGW